MPEWTNPIIPLHADNIGSEIASAFILPSTKRRSSSDVSAKSDIDSYTLVEGTTSIRVLLGRGVGVDTTLHIGEAEEDEGGSSIIQVSAQLHNDEITEFPVPEELVMLAQFLKQTKQTIFQNYHQR